MTPELGSSISQVVERKLHMRFGILCQICDIAVRFPLKCPLPR